MFTENIGFDFSEKSFEILSGRLGTLNHVFIGHFDDKEDEGHNIVFFDEPAQAQEYVEIANTKKTVCVVEQDVAPQELDMLVDNKNVLKISIRDNKISEGKGKV